MANLAAIIETMEALGHKPEDILAVVKAASARTSRQEINARHYAKRKAESLNKTSEQDSENHKKEISPTPPKEKTTSLTIVREKSTARETDFARVREAYPKRAGGDPPKTARKALEAALRRGADLEAIIAGARAFAVLRSSDDPKFTPMLATWLNQDRWLEDYTAPPPRAGPKPQRSVLSRIATGEFFDEPSADSPDQPTASGPVSSGGGYSGAVSERSRADGGGAVVNLRPAGSGWR